MTDLSPEFMYKIFVDGLIGTKEFRNWLANYSVTFADVRDPDVDAEIDRIARDRAERERQLFSTEETPSKVTREGEVVGG